MEVNIHQTTNQYFTHLHPLEYLQQCGIDYDLIMIITLISLYIYCDAFYNIAGKKDTLNIH